MVARDVRDLLVAHDAEVGAEKDDERRPLVDVEPVLKRLCCFVYVVYVVFVCVWLCVSLGFVCGCRGFVDAGAPRGD